MVSGNYSHDRDAWRLIPYASTKIRCFLRKYNSLAQKLFLVVLIKQYVVFHKKSNELVTTAFVLTGKACFGKPT
jgi:hypothetical protein